MSFDALSTDDQVGVLAAMARSVAADFGLDPGSVQLVLHAFNTTFQVHDGQGNAYALRLNTNSTTDESGLVAQLAWQRALAGDNAIRVPRPLSTPDGRDHVTAVDAAHDLRPFATVSTWLDGQHLDRLTPEHARALGRTMALLHEHAEGWSCPPERRLPVFDSPTLGDEDALTGHPLVAAMGPDGPQVIDRAFAQVRRSDERLYDGARPIALHADLHAGNLTWQDGTLSVFDFDDMGMGIPALDLAITTFYLRGGEPGAEAALRDGYAEVRPLPVVADADFEALVAARQLLLASTLAGSTAGPADQ